MPHASVRGVRLHYAEAGPRDGPVVLLLHGSFGSASDWSPYLPSLAEAGFRAVALDDRGHGGSTPFGSDGNPWSALSVPTLKEDARAFVDAVLPDGRVHVVGHSRGATVGAWLAYELGTERVGSLTAAASPPMASEAFRWRFRRIASERAPPDGYAGELWSRTVDYLSDIPDDHFPAELLTQYKGPGLVVEAGHDPLYSPTHTMFWRAWFHGARLERVEAGHDFPFEGGAAEADFRRLLLAFLAEVSPR